MKDGGMDMALKAFLSRAACFVCHRRTTKEGGGEASSFVGPALRTTLEDLSTTGYGCSPRLQCCCCSTNGKSQSLPPRSQKLETGRSK